MEVNVDEQVVHSHRQLLHTSLYAEVGQVANTANVENIWLSLPDTEPIITLQLSLAKPMQFRQGISSLLYKKELSTNIYQKTMLLQICKWWSMPIFLLYYK